MYKILTAGVLALSLTACATFKGEPLETPTGANATLSYAYAAVEEVSKTVEALRESCRLSESTNCVVDNDKASKVQAYLNELLTVKGEELVRFADLYKGASSNGEDKLTASLTAILFILENV